MEIRARRSRFFQSPHANGIGPKDDSDSGSSRPRTAMSGSGFRVGVLGLQGDYAKHEAAFGDLGVETIRVVDEAGLEASDALALPGGESTTLLRLLSVTGLRPALERFVSERPVFATCAGLILLARDLTGGGQVPYPPLGVLDLEVERNAYGRQVDSFEDQVEVEALGGSRFPGVFIRAPRIRRVGDGIEVVARRQGEPVGIRRGSTLGLCFHPELTGDRRLHRYFLETCCGRRPVEVRA
jgi:pyridoxal 5'-phosphate synthase pdxT subunit